MSDVPVTVPPATAKYPAGLVDWSGLHSGGVRKPFYEGSGRPCKIVIDTPLLQRVRMWAEQVVADPSAPRALLLVGGPGNGKTEAVEATLRHLDTCLGERGTVAAELTERFSGSGGRQIPRLVSVSVAGAPEGATVRKVCVVQDASMNDPVRPGVSAAELLVTDASQYLAPGSDSVYIACANRGVLDDALTFATERGLKAEQAVLEAVVRSVGQAATAPACWPLERFPHVAVWPMDVESLVWARVEAAKQSPAEQIIDRATDATMWPSGPCAAGDHCPFCRSRANLEKDVHRASLLQILRWNELATGKRWSFRDLFSLSSYLLAGGAIQEGKEPIDPCIWAAHLHAHSLKPSGAKPEALRFRAPFLLVAAQYEHALFGVWPRPNPRWLRSLIDDVHLETDRGLMGLYHFLCFRREAEIPATLAPQLAAMADALDPALADPSSRIELTSRTVHVGREIDARFSHSVSEGLGHVRRIMGVLEVEALQLLADSDEKLSAQELRRKQPVAAARLQNLVRDFACRLVRRSLGARYGVTREHEMLAEFEKVVAGDSALLHRAAKHVEALINQQDQFVVFLNTTFGEPLAPAPRRATLHTAKEKVRQVTPASAGRPDMPVRFLSVGSKEHPMPLTYDLFRSVRELEAGMLPASLPRPVVALLDATRARLGGAVVRDPDKLDGAEIRIRDTTITRDLDAFVVTRGGHT